VGGDIGGEGGNFIDYSLKKKREKDKREVVLKTLSEMRIMYQWGGGGNQK